MQLFSNQSTYKNHDNQRKPSPTQKQPTPQPDQIVSNIQKLTSEEADRLVLAKPDAKRMTFGMRNLGNTCFFNSVMQCLSHTRPLVNFCLSGSHTAVCKKRESCFLCLYTTYLKGIQQQQKTNPATVVYKLKSIWQRYSLGRQEDAHEFLIIFLESLVNSCFQMARPTREFLYKHQDKTALFNLIGGKSRSQVLCMNCGHSSNTYEDLITLSLDFPKNRQMGGVMLE